MKSLSRRALSAAFVAASLAVVMPFEGISAAPSPAPRFVSRPTMTRSGPLTKAQILKLAGHANQHVIIIFKNQFRLLQGRSRHLVAARSSAIAASQAAIISELRSVRASRVLPFHLINAIRATISPAEAVRLRANPTIQAVQADAVIPPPQLVGAVNRREHLRPTGRQTARRAVCTPSSTKPILQPQALQLTNTAFDNPNTPQAQNIATGRGVTVAIVSGPIAPYNPDFIRRDGTPVITDFENFGGDPPFTPGGGGGWDAESFLDMSSVASQGNEVFNLNDWAYNLGAKCETMRIRGMAPGANVMWLDAVGQNGETDSNFVQAIQYAFDNGANVISESFGGNPNNDTGVDATSLADAAAVAAGLTVVVSSGDAGSNNSLGTPANVRGVISAGATTSFQTESLIGRLKAQGNSGWVDNNVVSFSSSGIDQNGDKSVDIVAPGAFGFIDCTPDPSLFPGCTDYVTGVPLNFQIEGGTSESAPLTAGEAALVIQAFASTHGGAVPSPSTVKAIIMSTATDLGDPTWEQGAGLINSYRAVLAAKSWRKASKRGSALVASTPDLTAAGNPGAQRSLGFTVTNDGSSSQKVAPVGRVMGASRTILNVTLKAVKVKTLAQRQCAFSFTYSYFARCTGEATLNFTIPKGTGRFDADIAWNTVSQRFGEVEVRLVDPKGRYAGNSEPSDLGPPVTSAGYGHVDIARPTPGTWRAEIRILGFDPSIPLYSGNVKVLVTGESFAKFGSVTPASKTLAPGQSQRFMLTTKLPATAGDLNADVVVRGNGVERAGTIPVILRTLIKTNSSGGGFSGSFKGANGRPGAIWSTTYDFRVPANVRTLGLSLKLADSHDNVQGVLVDPEGYAINIQSTITGFDTNGQSPGFGLPNAYRDTIQFFQVFPIQGEWRLVLELVPNVSGSMISTPFTGRVRFNVSSASATGLPSSENTRLAAAKPVTVTVHVTNTGNTVKNYFVDPRLAQTAGYTLSERLRLPLNRPPFDSTPLLLVPPESGGLILGAESVQSSRTPSVPLMFTASSFDGAPPYGFGSDPQLISSPDFNPATSDFTAGLSFGTNYELPNGLWTMAPATVGPWPAGEPNTIASVGAVILTAAFDPAVTSTTGDLWQALGFGYPKYKPLSLAPGQSGTITVVMRPDQPSGALVSGALIVDAFAATGGFPFAQNSTAITFSGDEVSLLPYVYTVK